MTLFKTLMRVFAAAGASALLILIPDLIKVFQGPAPSDVSGLVWGVVGTVVVFVLNFVLGKVPRPPSSSAISALLFVLLSSTLLLACTPAEGAIGKPSVSVVAVGDTAKIFAGWQPANRATGYLVSATVAATNGTWAGLPTDATTSSTTSVITATSAVADSGRFVVCVKSTNSVVTSTAACSASAGWRRKLQPPSGVQIDSITLGLVPVASVDVTPSTATLVLP